MIIIVMIIRGPTEGGGEVEDPGGSFPVVQHQGHHPSLVLPTRGWPLGPGYVLVTH